MYHVNTEGKIYPCRAKVMKCPYGPASHAKTKEELYYITMKNNRTGEVSPGANSELALLGRLTSLESLNKDLANSKAPVEMIIATLERAIKAVETDEFKMLSGRMPTIHKRTFDRGAELVRQHFKNGLTIPKTVPDDIRLEGYKLFKDIDRGRMARDANYGSKGAMLEHDIRELKSMSKEFQDYKTYKKYGLNENNKESTLKYLKAEFAHFYNILNTSKQITKPVFFGSFEQAKEDIKKMDEYALLATYDDLMNPEVDLWRNVKEVNDFKYKPRNDLDKKANARLAEWYKMNEKIASSRRQNEGTRILLAMEIRKEIDNRGFLSGDFAIRK